MKTYMVGGCVRDMLLKRQPKDIDFVVVGATPEEMTALGYEKVGASFPVFLKNGFEYALARTERKTGVGYLGFETDYNPNVTLEEDLLRRDLTINSMAYDEETKTVIDPYGGQKDLEAGILRHTSIAFAEDPVRVLRTARFAARYGFEIAEETLELMDRVVPELDYVPPERIWAEIEKGLMERFPYKMFRTLENVRAFRADNMAPYRAGGFAAKLQEVNDQHDIVTRFALICSRFDDKDFIECRIPNECAIVGRTINKYFPLLLMYPRYKKEQRLMMLYELRVLNNRWLIDKCLDVLDIYGSVLPTREWVEEDLARIRTVDAAAIAAECASGYEVKDKLFKARVAVM